MIRAHRIRLHPTPEQAAYFVQASGIRRFVYNWGLEEWKRQYQAGRKTITDSSRLIDFRQKNIKYCYRR